MGSATLWRATRTPVLVQLREQTKLSSEDYIRQKAWLSASIEKCPLHPEGGCGFRKAGYYDRAEPEGLRVPFWHCPEAHCIFSLLPDFAAARVPSTLVDIEQAVVRFEQLRREADVNNEGAAASVRPDVEPAAAQRWVNRRRRWVRASLAIAIGLLSVLAGCEPSLESVRKALDCPLVLLRLRELLAAHLEHVPAPLGFGPLRRGRQKPHPTTPEKPGPAPPRPRA